MAVKSIIFDLGNTVVNFDHRHAVKRILPFTEKTFEEILQLFFDSDITMRFETGQISPQDFFLELKDLLGLEGLDYQGFLPIWNEIFFTNEASEKLVRRLKVSYRLVLLSNINKLHMDYLWENFAILKAFDEVVASYAVKSRKPDKAIYDFALEKCACGKNQVIYTDDREDLIVASSILGIPSVRFQDAASLEKEFIKRGVKL